MYECHPSSYHCPPRRSGWSRTYALIAISKGLNTLALTRSGPKSVKSFLGLSPKKALPQGIHEQNRKECKRGRSRARQAGQSGPATCLPHTPLREGGQFLPRINDGGLLARFL